MSRANRQDLTRFDGLEKLRRGDLLKPGGGVLTNNSQKFERRFDDRIAGENRFSRKMAGEVREIFWNLPADGIILRFGRFDRFENEWRGHAVTLHDA